MCLEQPMHNERISLADSFQRNMFLHAMRTLTRNKNQLRDYDRELYQKLQDGWDLVGGSMSLTRKQFNHIKVVAIDLESGKY